MVIFATEKHKKLLFYSSKSLFSAVGFSNTFTFSRNAHFDFKLTSVTIIKQFFLRRLFCNESLSLVDIEVSKH